MKDIYLKRGGKSWCIQFEFFGLIGDFSRWGPSAWICFDPWWICECDFQFGQKMFIFRMEWNRKGTI
jgi:hypothetical protein